MNIPLSPVRALLAVSVVLIVGSSDCLAEAAQSAQGDARTVASEEATLKKYLQTMDNDPETRYAVAFRDLNGDGIDEAVVYLLGGPWCGSGGCNTLILAQERGSWRVVTKITITRPPIRVLESVANGWHDIGVWVQGGGVRQGYEAELRFNGKTYPRNPSVAPAQRAVKASAGETLITAPPQGKALNGS
jgi:hypothetical protein